MINMKHLRHSDLGLQCGTFKCNNYATSENYAAWFIWQNKHPHRHLEVGKGSTGAWCGGGGPGPHIYCQVPDMSNSLGLIKHIGL